MIRDQNRIISSEHHLSAGVGPPQDTPRGTASELVLRKDLEEPALSWSPGWNQWIHSILPFFHPSITSWIRAMVLNTRTSCVSCMETMATVGEVWREAAPAVASLNPSGGQSLNFKGFLNRRPSVQPACVRLPAGKAAGVCWNSRRLIGTSERQTEGLGRLARAVPGSPKGRIIY